MSALDEITGSDEQQGPPLVLAGGRAVDPALGLDEPRDILIEHGRIAGVEIVLW